MRSSVMRLTRGVLAAALLVSVGCDSEKKESDVPGGADADDPGSRLEALEDERVGATQAPAVEGKPPAPQKALPKVRDRDPEEEKKKMNASLVKSAEAKKQLRAGRDSQAIETARAALRVHEQNVDAMLVIAEAFFKRGNYEITLAVTSSALAVDVNVRRPDQSSRVHNLRAFAYDRIGQPVLATTEFRNAAEADEKNAAAWNNLGTRYLSGGDASTAATCFEYALEIDPKFTKARVNLGAARRGEGKPQEAEKELLAALKEKPNFAEAYFNLGVLYLDAEPFPGLDTTQRLKKAIHNLERYRSAPATKGLPPRRMKGATAIAMGGDAVTKERADDYIRVAKKGLEREERRKGREAGRGAPGDDAAGDGAEDAAAGAGDAGATKAGPTPVKPGKPTPVQPGKPTPSKPGKPTPSKPGKPTPVQPGKPAPSKPGTPTPAKPGTPTPSKPAPSKPGSPTPVKPGKPAPSKPTPSKPGSPTPVQPSKPAPSKPAPSKPAPSKPAPSKPGTPKPVQPSKPAPSKPAPSKPGGGAQPKPVQPKPVQPKPVQPKPVKPTPVKPTPVKPK